MKEGHTSGPTQYNKFVAIRKGYGNGGGMVLLGNSPPNETGQPDLHCVTKSHSS